MNNLFNNTLEVSRIGDVSGWPYASEKTSGVFISGEVAMWREITWDDFVRGASMRYGGLEQTPEGVMKSYHDTNKSLTTVRERLKNPVNLKVGGPLRPSSICQLEREEKELVRTADVYRKLIKRLVKYNLLPTSKLISGANRKEFVFSLQTMIELPELGKAVHYANRLMGLRYDDVIPSTNDGYVQCLKEPGRRRHELEERSRESMYESLIKSLNETVQKLKTERERLLFSGTPWKPQKDDSDIVDAIYPGNEMANDQSRDDEKQILNSDKKMKVLRGGLYKTPAVVPNDLLSGEFNEWSKGQRSNVNHNENVKP
jgi:hypothetical protein